MDRFWQWAWERHGATYSWMMCAGVLAVLLPIYLLVSCVVVAFEESGHYVEAAAGTVVAVPVLVYLSILPSLGRVRLAEQWAAGHRVDRARALEATYTWARGLVARALGVNAVWGAIAAVGVAVIAGATGSRLAQYAILGAVGGPAVILIGIHSGFEAALRPVRAAIAGDTGIGDSLPRSRPTFAAWSNVSLLAAVFGFVILGAMLAAVLNLAKYGPALAVAIASALTLCGVAITVTPSFSPSLRPIRDLAEGTQRVAVGDYSQRLPVYQDDDLGALAASFNRMQAGLAERQRLQAAFGTYVDPALAARLLEQGDDVFTGERREVTVMFVDIRDFTPFAEANTAEDTVARLNALFEIVVPAVVDAGGHVNKFLGDGALAVFGAPNDLADHADAAVSAAVLIHRLVAEEFGGALRIGIGINTGVVIAGTIGGG
ncbi:adenylate/guanylate cyclase domain-containing protein, partial [Mycobacterium sp.]|uniref:adenylate/guanylate cyclase domain-containing protein n=1 Tax=Mycobacterium sp. TaxID=1785 RepID=UPI002D230D84